MKIFITKGSLISCGYENLFYCGYEIFIAFSACFLVVDAYKSMNLSRRALCTYYLMSLSSMDSTSPSPLQVTFDKQVMTKSVTLSGDTFDPSGTLSGGA